MKCSRCLRYRQRRSEGVRAAPGGTCLGAANERKLKKSRENSDCKFQMCFRAIQQSKTTQFTIKTKKVLYNSNKQRQHLSEHQQRHVMQCLLPKEPIG